MVRFDFIHYVSQEYPDLQSKRLLLRGETELLLMYDEFIECPNCWCLHEDGTYECDYCGHILPRRKKYCPNCNEIYSNDECFCILCGNELISRPKYNKIISFEKMNKKRKYCPYCGQQLIKHWQRCQYCRREVSNDDLNKKLKKLKEIKDEEDDFWFLGKKTVSNQFLRYCPRCNTNLVKVDGPHGEYYMCSNYPDCTFAIDKDYVDRVL